MLIIDEISMVDCRFVLSSYSKVESLADKLCRFFDKLDFVARNIRGQLLKPFGGLQIIATGDFFQLPPVVVGGGPAVSLEHHSSVSELTFAAFQPYCFKAMCFHDLFKDIHVLRQVFRQKDERFVKV